MQSNVPESSLPDEDFEEIAERMSALKLVSVISLVQFPYESDKNGPIVDVVRYQGVSHFRSLL